MAKCSSCGQECDGHSGVWSPIGGGYSRFMPLCHPDTGPSCYDEREGQHNRTDILVKYFGC